MKKIFSHKSSTYIKIALVIVIAIIYINYYNPYHIENNHQSIIQEIEELDIKLDSSEKTTIVKEVDIGNKKYILSKSDENPLKTTELTRGLFDRYKIEFVYTNEAFSVITTTKQQRYLVAFGEKFNKNINSIIVSIENDESIFDISDEDYFAVYLPIKEDIADITFSNVTDIIKIEIKDSNGEILRTIPVIGIE